ncbi:hypothetical protein JCGZ_25531 [Jatropha curcas]|uniref:Xaa-Pro dipeptidyl-peptidase-like domain-containing protein n=1 Tax=Jatropha curcas TaxID=180498 RepID=A0A067JX88_JATCU|nr:uncharacterized protein LOC105646508 [Jatropha curcas]KDP24615.1 hypothetical protein JCGZ_25531 [Jatropha curcas]
MAPRNAMETCMISTTDGVILQARIFKPPQETTVNGSSATVIVLVHPYSKLGGCQTLMQGLALRLSIKGFIAMTFDMRGAGRSTGRCSLTGFSEIEDVVSVCKWVSQNFPSNKILLVGSSAGAPIAGSAVDKVEEVIGYAGIGYPFGLAASFLFGRHQNAILQSPKPKLFVMGTNDQFTSVEQLEKKLLSAAGRVEAHLIFGVSHFEIEGNTYDARIADVIFRFLASLKRL